MRPTRTAASPGGSECSCATGSRAALPSSRGKGGASRTPRSTCKYCFAWLTVRRETAAPKSEGPWFEPSARTLKNYAESLRIVSARERRDKLARGFSTWRLKTYLSRPGMTMKQKADDIMRLAYDWKNHKEAYDIKYSMAWRKYLGQRALAGDNSVVDSIAEPACNELARSGARSDERLDHRHLTKRAFAELRDYLGLHWNENGPALGVYELRPRAVQLGLNNVVKQARRLLSDVDSRNGVQGVDKALLTRTGLDRIIKRVRNIVRKIPYNAVVRTSQRHLAPVAQELEGDLELLIHAADKDRLVKFRPEYRPAKDAEDTLFQFGARLLVLKEEVDKIFDVASLAAHFDRHINWDRYRRLLVDDNHDKVTLDFLREAFIYGIHVRRAFQLAKDAGRWERRAFNRLISKDDLKHASLQTWSHEIRIKLPDDCEDWAAPGADILMQGDPVARQIKSIARAEPDQA